MNRHGLFAAIVIGALCCSGHRSDACCIVPNVRTPTFTYWVVPDHVLCVSYWEETCICLDHWEWSYPSGAIPASGSPEWQNDCPAQYIRYRYYTFPNVGTYNNIEATAYSCCDPYDVYDSDWLRVHVVTMGVSPAPTYIGVNDDDDDEDGYMDNCGGPLDEGEDDDLVEADLLVNAPGSEYYDTVELAIWHNPGKLQVWGDNTRTDQILPDPSTSATSRKWTVGGQTSPIWLEGMAASTGEYDTDPYLRWQYWGQNYYTLDGWDPDYWITVVHVDMDMDGVKDDTYTWPGITEETTPGGFIPLGGTKSLTIKKVAGTTTAPDVTLSWTGSKIEVWDGSTKLTSGKVYHDSELPKTVSVKGVAASSSLRDTEMTLQSTLGGQAFQDKIKLTVYSVNLDIHSGQGSANPVPETDQDADGIEDEEDIGAFTVANLNDTNGDGYADSDDSHRPVTANGSCGRNEIDLMKLVLRKPKPDGVTGDVRLIIVSGSIEIWSDSVKTTQITNLTFPTSNFTGDTIDWYVEARSSTALQGIKLKYEFRRTGTTDWIACDTVAATGIWATCSQLCSADFNAATVDTFMGTDYVNNGGIVRSNINVLGGTGVRPSGWPWGNVIVLGFTVSPSNISSVPANHGNGTRARPYFDITRVRETFAAWWQSTGAPNIDPHTHFPETLAADSDPTNDIDFEYVNDDPPPPESDDETSEPTASGCMWVMDSPGYTQTVLLVAQRGNFDEFLRMGISADPIGNNTFVGSRCSPKQPWCTKMTRCAVGTSAGPNEIHAGHFTFEPEALHTYVPSDPTLASYATVEARGLAVAGIAGSTPESVDLYVQEDDIFSNDTLARYDGQHIGTNYDIHEWTTPGSKPQMVGKSSGTLMGDQTAYTGVTLIGTAPNGAIWGYHGGCGEGQSGDAAEVFHKIGSSNSSVDNCYGQAFSMGAPTAPNPLVFGNNNVTCPSLYVEATAHGPGTQNVTVDLWEDEVVDDHLASVNAVATRGADAIQNTAIQVTAVGGGPVIFVVSNAAGTISGNTGSNDANESPVQLYYNYSLGASPVTEVSVQQP